MQTVVVLDYGLANIRSVVNALECFPVSVRVSGTIEDLKAADKLVLPGVGSFDAGMQSLHARRQVEALHEEVLVRCKPFLGICLGFQFLFDGSGEGKESGLGWIKGSAIRFDSAQVKVPHIGWTEVESLSESQLFAGIRSPADFYFVHSFYVPFEGDAKSCASGLSNYSVDFIPAIERGNIFGVQFHPEKSQLAGMKLLENFLAI
jgi:glutamine amidotransferase